MPEVYTPLKNNGFVIPIPAKVQIIIIYIQFEITASIYFSLYTIIFIKTQFFYLRKQDLSF